MKHIKRVFTMLLAMVLLFSGVVEPLSLTAQAAAENVPTLGSNNVGNTPDELLSLGEWQYWIENGMATIAGYTNTAEAELSIPDKLGGCPVTGIGSHAFRANEGLVSIYIPTNVTRIADDAFEGLSVVSIRAYHGAFALVYASNHSLGTNEITQPGVEFVEGVIDLSGLPSGAFSNLSDYSVVFNTLQATFLAAGQIVVFPQNANYPSGLARRIESISKKEDHYLVTLSEPEWNECFERVYGEDELILDWEHAVLNEGFTLTEVQDSASSFEFSPINASIGPFSGNLKFKMKTPTIEYEIARGNGLLPELKFVDIYVPIEFSCNASGKLVDEDYPIPLLPIGDIPIITLYGVINGYLSLDLVISSSGEIKIESKINCYFNIHYRNGKVTTERGVTPSIQTAEIEAKVEVGPRLSFYLVLGKFGLEIRILEISGKFSVSVAASAKYTPIIKGSRGSNVCVDIGSVSASLTFEGKIGIIKIAKKESNPKLYAKVKITFGPWPVGQDIIPIVNSHFDNFHYVGNSDFCVLKDRKIIFLSDGKVLRETDGDVNNLLPGYKFPDKPYKSGYKYLGWYVDAAKSQLSCGDYYFDPLKEVVPLCGDSGILYLYAKYERILHPVTAVTLSQTNVTTYTNNTNGIRLSATISPANADDPSVTWSSSNNSIATVDQNGLVRFYAPGIVTITCKSDSNRNVTAQCKFTVKQYAESVDIGGSIASLVVGEITQLSSSVLPSNATDKSLEWISSSADVASVNNDGLVTAVGAGRAVITATARDGSGKSDSYNIRVCAVPAVTPMIPVTNVALTNKALTAYTVHKTAQLTAVVTPENADDTSLVWSSNNENIATVDDNGLVSLVKGGRAIITVRSASNPYKYDSCVLTVIQSVETINVSTENTTIEIGETTQAYAEVLPSYADDKRVSWSSENEAIAIVDTNGQITGVANGNAWIRATAEDGSGIYGRTRIKVGIAPPIPVTNIVLDKTAFSLYTNDKKGVQLTATVSPADADDPSITWQTSNSKVATVDNNGLVKVHSAGTVVITCRSVSNPGVEKTCTVTVKQYMDQLYVEALTGTLLPGETTQLSVDVFPEDTTDKSVTWSSSNVKIATVNSNGLVTAVAPGSVTITATAKDGSKTTDSFKITVEKELQLEVNMVNDTVYLQGDSLCDIAYVALSSKSARYIAQSGYTPSWSMTRTTGSGDTELEEIASSINLAGTEYQTVMAHLSGSIYPTAGTEIYTIRCQAGNLVESIDVSVTVDGTQYAESVKLRDTNIGSNTFTAGINETAMVPKAPYSTDGNPVPEGLRLEVFGDRYYEKTANETQTADGVNVSFDESGEYAATVRYTKSNLTYELEAAFQIADADGIIRLRVTEIALSDSFLSMVQGEKATITATIAPTDCYNKTLEWTSSDPTVATVSSSGVVQGLAPGNATITCAATDGSEVSSYCMVRVESLLQLDESALSYTVYANGADHVDLDTVNITVDSSKRLIANGLNTTWTLSRLTGDSTELGIEEYRAQAEEDVSVSGVKIKLLRMHHIGTDIYRLDCVAGDYADSCTIKIEVIEADLPETIVLSQNNYHANINEKININADYSLLPSTAALPTGTNETLEGGNAFMDAISGLYSYSESKALMFKKAGTYSANLVFYGDNYQYTCPITFVIANENGVVPENISKVNINEEELFLTTGESRTLSVSVEPSGTPFGKVSWSSSDTSVATVSSKGIVTAIGPGITSIVASIPESDYTGSSLVFVEEGINFWNNELERTVFVDGDTRMTLDTLMLTDNTSSRLTKEPEWTLRRVSGISLTLRAVPYETVNTQGVTLYGCSLMLYSVSKEGDTVYELTCSNGTDTATATITVHAVTRERVLPASITLDQTTFTADIGELIIVRPNITTYPAGTVLPNGILLNCEGDAQYQQALNADDTFVSQSVSTFSFNKAGTYETRFVYSYSNMKYVVPVTFRIRNANGDVPVQTSKLALSHKSLYLTVGETDELEAVFTPANATNQMVTWSSSNPNIVTVDGSGKVTAIANGTATISCAPDDEGLNSITCPVTVEDYLSVETGSTTRTLYLQGEQENSVGYATLSEGTRRRIAIDGLTPVWTINSENVMNASIYSTTENDGASMTFNTSTLKQAGTATYTVSCHVGTHTWSQIYTLKVVDLGNSAPLSLNIATPDISVPINTPVSVDFSPIVAPAGASLPTGIRKSGFIGIGEFYQAYDQNSYSVNGDIVTVAFTKPGQYILARRYTLSNLQYVTSCTFTVGSKTEKRGILKASETNFTVYKGGKSGSVSTVSLADDSIYQLWQNDISWAVERLSGDSMTIALKENAKSVDVFVANVQKNGTDVWRVNCNFGGMTEYIDITLTAADPRGPLPESLSIAQNQFSGMIGNWISVPIGAICEPIGSMLPDQGDEFWHFNFDQAGEERSSHTIENGMLHIDFAMSGYYTGTLRYQSGNVQYDIPMYFAIMDEEMEVKKPDLRLYTVNACSTVYPEGEMDVPIAQLVISDGLNTYNTGSAIAYMSEANASWKLMSSNNNATFRLEEVSPNVYNLILNKINRTGDTQLTVTCTVDGKEYSITESIHIASAKEARPNPTLKHTEYRVHVGETVEIDYNLYSRDDGSILQSSSTMDFSALLSAVGYEISENGDGWAMTFYEPGSFNTTVSAYVSNLKLDVPITITVLNEGTEIEMTTLKFPIALCSIEAGAFEGIATNIVDLRGSAITSIGDDAFKNCIDLYEVYIPACVSYISETAFYGCLNVSFYCGEDTYAANWARQHNIPVNVS